jgi:uncharacterized protein YuzE
MHIGYDPRGDILYVALDTQEGVKARRSAGKKLDTGGAYVDLAADGTILAIEIQDASRRYDQATLDALLAYPDEAISLVEAAKLSGIDAEALKKACQRGTLAGKKIGRNWTTTVGAVTAYKARRKHAGPGSRSVAG